FAEGAIAQLQGDQIHTVRGEVVAVNYTPVRPRPRFEATIFDGNAKLALVWFNMAYLRTRIHPGQTIRVRGRVKFFRNMPQMANPRWEIIEPDAEQPGIDKFRPIYPATAHLPSEMIGTIIDQNLDAAAAEIQ